MSNVMEQFLEIKRQKFDVHPFDGCTTVYRHVHKRNSSHNSPKLNSPATFRETSVRYGYVHTYYHIWIIHSRIYTSTYCWDRPELVRTWKKRIDRRWRILHTTYPELYPGPFFPNDYKRAPHEVERARICVSITVTMAYQVNSMRKRRTELQSAANANVNWSLYHIESNLIFIPASGNVG